MKIKIGASYRMRNGGIVTIANQRGDAASIGFTERCTSITYNANGQQRAAWGDPQFDLTGEQVTRCYIAGPMSGIADLNFPAFNAAAALYRKRGCLVINPAELVPEVSPHLSPVEHWNYCMRIDIAALMTCEMVVVLPGWENSKGAQLELRIAADLGMAITWPDTVAVDPWATIMPLPRACTAEEFRAQYMTQPVDMSAIEQQEEKRRARELLGKNLKRRAGEDCGAGCPCDPVGSDGHVCPCPTTGKPLCSSN